MSWPFFSTLRAAFKAGVEISGHFDVCYAPLNLFGEGLSRAQLQTRLYATPIICMQGTLVRSTGSKHLAKEVHRMMGALSHDDET